MFDFYFILSACPAVQGVCPEKSIPLPNIVGDRRVFGKQCFKQMSEVISAWFCDWSADTLILTSFKFTPQTLPVT